MNKLAISINLLGLQGAVRATVKGEDCIIVRLGKSRAKPHDNGKVYLNLDAIENSKGHDDYGNSHFVCEPLTKDERLSGAEKFPIIGNARTFGDGPKPQQNSRPAQRQGPQQQEEPPPDAGLDGDDIPF